MSIKVRCASCGSTLNAPDSAAGRRARCSTCKAPVHVPDPAAVAEAPEVSQAINEAFGLEDHVEPPETSFEIHEPISFQRVAPVTRPTIRRTPAVDKSTSVWLGLIGCALLLTGVFVPIVNVPLIGGMNYFQNGKGDGVFIIAIAIVSLFLIMLRCFGGLWLTSAMSLTLTVFALTTFCMLMRDNRGALAGSMIQLQWGWAVLFIGGSLLAASAFTSEVGANPEGGTALSTAYAVVIVVLMTATIAFTVQTALPPGILKRTLGE